VNKVLNVESFVLLFLFTNGISYYVCFWNKKFEETKGVIRIRKSKDRQHNGQTKRSNVQTTIYKTLHRKRETRTPLFKPGVSSGAPE
jgi:hypothetical protein